MDLAHNFDNRSWSNLAPRKKDRAMLCNFSKSHQIGSNFFVHKHKVRGGSISQSQNIWNNLKDSFKKDLENFHFHFLKTQNVESPPSRKSTKVAQRYATFSNDLNFEFHQFKNFPQTNQSSSWHPKILINKKSRNRSGPII